MAVSCWLSPGVSVTPPSGVTAIEVSTFGGPDTVPIAEAASINP